MIGPEVTWSSSPLTDAKGHKSKERMTDNLEETQRKPPKVLEEGEEMIGGGILN